MPELQKFTVVSSTGARGHVLRRARFLDRSEQNTVVLEDGRELMVPSEALEVQSDGSFRLNEDSVQTGELHSPQNGRSLASEQLKQQFDAPPAHRMNPADAREAPVQAPVEPAIRHASLNETLHEDGEGNYHHEISLDEQLFSEEVDVQRVPINRLVDEVPETRHEGDVLIVPVVEEVFTIQKRLLLKEEVRVQRHRNTVRQPRRVILTGNEARIIGSDGRDITDTR